MSVSTAQRWYVVQTQPNAEAKAADHLARQGFTVFLPRYLRKRRHARRVDTVASPLFPRYLFVAMDTQTQRWRCIRSTIGVARLVCNGDEPAAVAGNAVEQLRSARDERGFVKLDTKPDFVAGQRLRVLDGVFSACLGLYEGMADSDRVAILLELLGRKVRVLLDVDSVATA